MAEIYEGEFKRNETNENSIGGTELLNYALLDAIPKEKLGDFQIVSSRVRELDQEKIRIFWAHDLPQDPENKLFADGIHQFHMFVFVSNWQAQGYINMFNIPWSKCLVLQNAIQPIEPKEKPTDTINLIYHSTPHRGLNILAAVYEKLLEKHDNITLDVYSSFELYGWGKNDENYKMVFDKLESLPTVTNHGTVSNSEIRSALQNSHIFAYPSTWQETSCLCLMEAMAAGNICVHPNYGALYETAANWTEMYQWHEDVSAHASTFYNMLDGVITNYDVIKPRTASAASYANLFYGWPTRTNEWNAVLQLLSDRYPTVESRTFEVDPSTIFSYSTTNG